MPKTPSIEVRDADKELVARVLSGSEDAKNELYLRHRQRLLLTASSLLGYRDPEAEDMVHETVLAGLKDLARFEFRSNLHTWLTQICVNLCLKALRKRQRLVVEADDAIEHFCSKGSLDSHSRQGEAAAKAGRLALLKGAMSALKKGCREILGLRYDEGLEYGAIADRARIPVGTVMSRLSRCRTLLKDIVLRAARKAGHA